MFCILQSSVPGTVLLSSISESLFKTLATLSALPKQVSLFYVTALCQTQKFRVSCSKCLHLFFHLHKLKFSCSCFLITACACPFIISFFDPKLHFPRLYVFSQYIPLYLFLFWLFLWPPSEKAMAPHSSTLAWKIPWTEEPGGLQSMGSLRVGHDWVTSFHFSLSCIGEGNGNPLQCSCLENPRDGGAWWAAIYGVAQGRTRLKRLSSSSSGLPTADLKCILSCNCYILNHY